MLLQKRELTEFCGKCGEFCEKLGEFALAHAYTHDRLKESYKLLWPKLARLGPPFFDPQIPSNMSMWVTWAKTFRSFGMEAKTFMLRKLLFLSAP